MLPQDELVPEAIRTAEKIAGLSKIIVRMAKEAVNSGKSGACKIARCG